jgi:transcriptional regulator with XRE-family HTH domain
MPNFIYSKEHKFIVQQLKKARNEAGLAQEKVAQILNTSQSYISKLESGQRKIDIVQLKEFTRIYKKDINFFIK